MYRRNALLVVSALALTQLAACKYDPQLSPDPGTLHCQDDNGCPAGYHCLSGACCNQADAAACFAPADATAPAKDVGIPDAPADLHASDVAVAPDRSPPGVDAAADVPNDHPGTGGSGGSSGNGGTTASGGQGAGGNGGSSGSGGITATGGLGAGGGSSGGAGGSSGNGGTTSAGGSGASVAGGSSSNGGATATGGTSASVTFTASPAAIFSGDSLTLTWSATGATAVSIEPGIGSVSGKTSQVVNPTQTTTYTLTLNGLIAAQVTVTLLQGVFAQAGDMIGERDSHTATLLQDGKVLVAGGLGRSGSQANAELYDSGTGEFSATGNMIGARNDHTATLLPDGRVLVAGGFNDNLDGSEQWLATAELYDPATGKFATTGSMLALREFHTATLLQDGRVLVAGGNYNSGTAIAAAELYDPATRTFTATAPMKAARMCHTATLLPNGMVLIAGGYAGGADLATAELYDPKTGMFSATGPMKEARQLHTATLLQNGTVLVAGGEDNDATIASAELYNAGVFTATGNLTEAREWHTATLLQDGLVLIAGGSDAYLAIASANLYDPKTGKFTTTGNLHAARELHQATLLKDGTVLITGGFVSDYLTSAELFK